MFNLKEELLADWPVVDQIKPWRSLQQDRRPKRILKSTKNIEIEVFMDPLSPLCWALEPIFKKIEIEFGTVVKMSFRTAGMMISWDDYSMNKFESVEEVSAHWDDLGALHHVPIQGGVWLEDPPHSSYPACIAFKAAQLQSKGLAMDYLRRIQEMTFVEGVNMAKWKNLKKAAVEVGLDPEVLLLQYNNGDGLKAFAADQKISRDECIKNYPTFHLKSDDGRQIVVDEVLGWESFKKRVQSLLPSHAIRDTESPLRIKTCFEIFGSLTINELNLLSGLESNQILEELNELEETGYIGSFGCKSGRVWHLVA